MAGILGTAGTPGVAGEYRTHWSTAFSIGLQWNFGDSRPEVVLAARRTATLPHSQVYGGQIDLAMPLEMANPLQWPTVRLLGLAGGRYSLAQAGLGVQMGSWAPVGALGVQLPYTTAGANYVLGQGIKPYAGVNSFGVVTAPTYRAGTPATPATAGTAGTPAVPGPLSCPTGTTMVDITDPLFTGSPFNGVASLVSRQGKTCFNAV